VIGVVETNTDKLPDAVYARSEPAIEVDEWKLIRDGNMPMAIILSTIVLSLAIVIAASIRP